MHLKKKIVTKQFTLPLELLKKTLVPPPLPFSFYILALLKNIRVCWNKKKCLKYFILSLMRKKPQRRGGWVTQLYFEDTGRLMKHDNSKNDWKVVFDL